MIDLAPADKLPSKTTVQLSMPDLEEFMTTKEAADKLGYHVKSIPKMLRDNILDGERFGHAWLVSRKWGDNKMEADIQNTKPNGESIFHCHSAQSWLVPSAAAVPNHV